MITRFKTIGSLVIFFSVFCLALGCSDKTKKTYHFLVSTYTTGTTSKGIYILSVNPSEKQMKILHTISSIPDPSYTVNIGGKDIYAVSEVDNFKPDHQGAVYHLSLDKNLQSSTQELTGTHGAHPCHLNISNGWLSVANYTGGNVTFFKLDEQHKMVKEITFQHRGKGSHERQLSPHAHFVGSHPWSPQIVYAVDLGADKIMTYETTDSNVRLIDSTVLRSGKGARHIAFHPTLSMCVLINELEPSVSLYSIDEKTHKLTMLDNVRLGKSSDRSPSYASGIAIHPEHLTIYALNRGENTISTLSLTDDHQKLKLKRSISCGGNWPRSLSISPDGAYVFVSNQKSNNISVFAVNEKDGSLSPVQFSIKIPSPTHVDFLE